MKTAHEVRDGLYGFIEFDNLIKQLIDSAPFQRLRSIHQLAMCYQVYLPRNRSFNGDSEMDFQKHAIILAMIDGLQANGARTGKVHVMKGLGLAKMAGLFNAPFDFFLYKHGPYSTDIEQNFEEMASYAGIKINPAADGWGVILKPGDNAPFIKQHSSLSAHDSEALQRACRFLRGKNAKELERVATAMWIRKEIHIDDPDEVALKLNELKPHVTVGEARIADQEACSFLTNGD